MNYLFRPSAEKQFAKLDSQTQSTIANKLSFFASTPNPLSFAKRLTRFDGGQYRFRIGDYRVTFDIKEQTMVILAIGHRSEIYKKWNVNPYRENHHTLFQLIRFLSFWYPFVYKHPPWLLLLEHLR